jgi:hypothetical protein
MSGAFRSTWEMQARWSTTASVLKQNVGRARTLVLLLTVAGAVLVTLGGTVSGFDAATGKALGLAGAVALALAPVINKRSASGSSVGSWVRARSAAERLKTELYFYLTRTGLYGDSAGADRQLVQRRDALLADVDDLGPRSEQVTPVVKEPPPITDVASYIEHRVNDQIDRFYRPRVRALSTRLTWLRRAEYALTLTAAGLGAAASLTASKQPALWVPVVTTIATAVGTHIAAERYEALVVAYVATARKLSSLRDQWPDVRGEDGTPLDGSGFVVECESVMSAENQSWLADWLKAAAEPGARTGPATTN